MRDSSHPKPPPLQKVGASDINTDRVAEAPIGFAVTLIAGLHVLCCGLPLLLLSGVSLATISPSWSVLGATLALLGSVGSVWVSAEGLRHLLRQSEALPKAAASCRTIAGVRQLLT